MSAPNLHTTAGPLFIGTFVSTAVWTGSLAQTWIYLVKYPNDRPLYKLWVAGVCVSSAAGIILLVGSTYLSFVSNFGNFTLLLDGMNLLACAEIAVASTIYAQVQTFFVYRIWRLSENIYMVIMLEFLVLVQFFLCIAMAVLISGGSSFQAHPVITTIASIDCVLVEIALATTLCVLLRQRQALNMEGSTQVVVRRLLAFSLSSGVLLAVLGTCIAIAFLAFPHNGVFRGLYEPTCFLQANSMLAALNARSYIMRSGDNFINHQIDDLIAMQSVPLPDEPAAD